jgi:hypothetical protein
VALRFLADHCVSNRITNALREAGHDVLRLRDHMAVESSGLAVISKIRELGVTLLSHNGDFCRYSGLPYPASSEGSRPCRFAIILRVRPLCCAVFCSTRPLIPFNKTIEVSCYSLRLSLTTIR